MVTKILFGWLHDGKYLARQTRDDHATFVKTMAMSLLNKYIMLYVSLVTCHLSHRTGMWVQITWWRSNSPRGCSPLQCWQVTGKSVHTLKCSSRADLWAWGTAQWGHTVPHRWPARRTAIGISSPHPWLGQTTIICPKIWSIQPSTPEFCQGGMLHRRQGALQKGHLLLRT